MEWLNQGTAELWLYGVLGIMTVMVLAVIALHCQFMKETPKS